MKTNVLVILFVILYGPLLGQNVIFDTIRFKSIFAIQANEKFIDVNTGHSAPCVYDFNKDGVDDLLVGEFGKEYCPDVDKRQAHAYVQGRCRIYINYGTNVHPVYKDYQWLMGGGKPAFVPITCCISFVPRIADLDGDGEDDVLSGSFPGEIYFFKGMGNGDFGTGCVLLDKESDTIRAAHSMSADPIDWDNDGDYDILISSRTDGVFLLKNIGTKKQYIFEKPIRIDLKKHKDIFVPSYLGPQDWGGDGLFDLVGGTEWGDLVWYKNIGTLGAPIFSDPMTLWANPNFGKNKIEPLGGRVKTWVCDYNKDGVLDILAGEVNTIMTKIRDLTPAQEIKKNKLQEKTEFLSKQKKSMEQAYKAGCLTKKEKRIYESIDNQCDKIVLKLKGLNNFKDGGTHGYVWVFLRK
ncbi:MAG: VCBS repeat-containing protein [Odoribacter sp.]